MPVAYSNVYLHAAGMFLPGEPVDNAGMDAYVAPLNRLSERLKRRILAENGIVQRHYAIDAEGRTSIPGVWAGGDCAFGGQDLTVSAVAMGRDAAESINRSLAVMTAGATAVA